MSPSRTPSPTPSARPRVLIVGASIGGLILGLLLEKADIPYVIFESASSCKPIGSPISIGGDMSPLFRQLGIYDVFKNASVESSEISMRNENSLLDFVLDFSKLKTMEGAEGRVISRVTIYDILLRKVPRDRVLFNKTILTMKNTKTGIHINCSDHSRYEFDILVGADGANSAVRHSLFDQLREEGRLPLEDDLPSVPKGMCFEGQTSPLSLDQFPELATNSSLFSCMRGIRKPFSWVTFSTKSKAVGWMVVQNFDHKAAKNLDTPKVPDCNLLAMSSEVRHLPIPNGPPGSTLGTLIDQTHKNLISKICFDERIFKTWFSGRVVLLGDACRSLNPARTVSEMTAIHDAVCLANWMNVLRSREINAVEEVFNEYYNERYPASLVGCGKRRLFESSNANFFRIARAFISKVEPYLAVDPRLEEEGFRLQASSVIPATGA